MIQLLCMFFGRGSAVVVLFAAVQLAWATGTVEQVIEVDRVWSGHKVGFCLLTCGDRQYVAYYDSERYMTVAARPLDSDKWVYKRLNSRLGWDSHNYVTMAVDSQGYLHVSGNMHVVPLVYFRTERPWDVNSLRRIDEMVGTEERRCTYPRFFTGPQGQLIFTYRDGSSGSGNQIYNVYDVADRQWRRLLDRPLTDGLGKANAYIVGPIHGPDGYLHFCWVWRDTPDCRTNHDLCYVRTRDFRRWENAAGQVVSLPITPETKDVIVDPVPVGGGMINGNTQIGFDSKGRVIISYHKFDSLGRTQLYNARFEQGGWRIYQSSNWDYRWDFGGGGTIHFEIRVRPVVVQQGCLTQSWGHDRYGSGKWQLDEKTLKPVRLLKKERPWPAELMRLESDFPGMQVRMQQDNGSSGEASVRYVARWESLGPNRDRPRKEVPPPSTLRVYKLRLDQ